MDFTVHERISEFVKSTALTPPRRQGEDGFDLLDVVVVNPASRDPAKMLIPTGTNINKHYTKHKIHKRNESHDSYSKKEVRRSEESFALTDELQSALGIKGVKASTRGGRKSTTNVNLLISGEKTYSISGATFHLIEQVVNQKFSSIVKNAAKYVIARNTDDHWYGKVFKKKEEETFYFAVITKVYLGNFSIEETDSDGANLGASMDLSAVPVGSFVGAEASADGSFSSSVSIHSKSTGIVGVQMLCFPFQRVEAEEEGGEEKGYYTCDPIKITWLDKKERLKLTKISKERHWKFIENTGDSEIYYERGKKSRSKSYLRKLAHEARVSEHRRLFCAIAVAVLALVLGTWTLAKSQVAVANEPSEPESPSVK